LFLGTFFFFVFSFGAPFFLFSSHFLHLSQTCSHRYPSVESMLECEAECRADVRCTGMEWFARDDELVCQLQGGYQVVASADGPSGTDDTTSDGCYSYNRTQADCNSGGMMEPVTAAHPFAFAFALPLTFVV
jgi:hypothetical protein